ncbi:phosphatidylethanolamine N-methyltransferas-like protein [Byssothecium circinans]|uniref:Phosphatidylethanolamine N-methyltransferase n=1 Tax=Byssothecium circinans TaxID=147558 RepID=A0A6A5U3U3_9PLEO|nr:phosphatidylethanolamine N-methyltransferas-like protein [Byssothecium circinans]
MADTSISFTAPDDSQLRERPSAKPLHLHNPDDARQKVLELNDDRGKERKDAADKRTYGRTPDGTVFIVPQTHDMVSQLLSPAQPKNLSDYVILGFLAILIFTLFALPKSARRPVFAAIFLFWRAAYNAGIGWLLHHQSNHNRLVLWAKNSGIFEKPESGKNPYPKLYDLLKYEMETKIPHDYKFEEAPLEYNTWLLFRRVVDLILMCDFVSYCLFAIACFNRPDESWVLWSFRWMGGIILFLFNLWVKLDAHRVVKDFAWYWGDFFFLIDQQLTFDGVFEMAPHPMYSVGYAGYYGISMMTASYSVLFISIAAHAAQFAFLSFVESPHIDKTYNTPPPRKRPNSHSVNHEERPTSRHSEAAFVDGAPLLDSDGHPSEIHHIVGLRNIDLHRTLDVTTIAFTFYMFCFAIMTPNTWPVRTFFLVNAFVWRLWYALGLGYILDRQSKKKNWTRHFIKYGDSKMEAWRQWKYLYHLSMTMCYVSFVSAAWKMYAIPPDWSYGWTLLRHVIGVGLIALQLWVVKSIHEALGEFGWFSGDFFFDPPSRNLTYSGIYRFLNNPERVLGVGAVWGIALITWSVPIFYLAGTAHILNLVFLQFVERPHMQKLYGQSLRKTSGVSKTFRQALPSPVRNWQSTADDYLNSTVEFIEEFIDTAGPKLAAGMDTFVKDASAIFKAHPTRITIARVAPDLAGIDPTQYRLEIIGKQLSSVSKRRVSGGREGEMARAPADRTSEFNTLVLEYGTPIKVRWRAPINHSKKDWIGFYMVADNAKRDITKIGSNGRWVSTNKGVFDSSRAEEGILVSEQHVSENGCEYFTGEVEFRGDKLWWTTGVFEFRYHHDGKHSVLAISQAFEIKVPKFAEDDAELDANGTLQRPIEEFLAPLIKNCFDGDTEIYPDSVDEPFGSIVERDEKYAKRVVFAVHQMFGIEFAPQVVPADGTIHKLAWRICHAKQVLAPYSMSANRGRNTPKLH